MPVSANPLPADPGLDLDRGAPRPSRTRHGVVVFAILLAVICYTDRVIIAQAAPEVQRDLGLSEVQMGWVFLVFTWAYFLGGLCWILLDPVTPVADGPNVATEGKTT